MSNQEKKLKGFPTNVEISQNEECGSVS